MTGIVHNDHPLSFAEYQAGKLADGIANITLQHKFGAMRGGRSGDGRTGEDRKRAYC
jgi:hypothetical protein